MNWHKPLEALDISLFEGGLTLAGEAGSIRFTGSILSVITEQGETLHPEVSLTRRDELGTLSASFASRSDIVVQEVRWFDGKWSNIQEIQAASSEYCDICVFLRGESGSFFLSLDFPYSKIKGACVTYDPWDRVPAGRDYEVHTLTVGAVRLSGSRVGFYDRAEIEGMSAYIDKRIPPRFNRAVFSSTCITNRMTDVREGRVYYSMYDNPTLTLEPETLKKEVRLCAELGIEYLQLFEGFYDWEEDGTSERNLGEIVALAKEKGVRIGDYMTPSELYCGHYNYHGRTVTDAGWRVLDEDGERGQLCYGRGELIGFLKDTLVKSLKKNRQQFICLDGNAVVPCFDPEHDHGPGIYAQVRGIVRFMEEMNALDDNFLTWSNSGNWLAFMPKLLWYNQNVYLTDPHPRDYSSSLNTLKYYGDCRREQMVSVHNQYFVPYTYYCNCEYYAFPHARVDDTAFFEYSFLQGLCVTPNICLGELRTFLDRIPASKVEFCKTFMKKWMDFTRNNYDVYKNVFQLGDAPGAGANEAYAHIDGDRGWICFVNQNPYTQTFSFRLDASVGLSGGERFLLTEEYPETCPIAGQRLPYTPYGTELTLSVPAYSVRIVRLEPYTPAEHGFRFYGMPGQVVRDGGNVRISLSGECGKRYACAAVFEGGQGPERFAVQTVPTVPLYTHDTRIENIRIAGNTARFDLVMPRDYFQREISEWKVAASAVPVKLSHANSDFCGGYIHNFYKEKHNAVVTVSFCPAESASAPPPPAPETGYAPIPRQAAVYETTLDIPFIEWPVMARGYGFDEVLELVFADANSVKNITAALDGNPCEVRTYEYPCARHMKTFYIELVGKVSSGAKPLLRLAVEWSGAEAGRGGGSQPKSKKSGAYVMGR